MEITKAKGAISWDRIENAYPQDIQQLKHELQERICNIFDHLSDESADLWLPTKTWATSRDNSQYVRGMRYNTSSEALVLCSVNVVGYDKDIHASKNVEILFRVMDMTPDCVPLVSFRDSDWGAQSFYLKMIDGAIAVTKDMQHTGRYSDFSDNDVMKWIPVGKNYKLISNDVSSMIDTLEQWRKKHGDHRDTQILERMEQAAEMLRKAQFFAKTGVWQVVLGDKAITEVQQIDLMELHDSKKFQCGLTPGAKAIGCKTDSHWESNVTLAKFVESVSTVQSTTVFTAMAGANLMDAFQEIQNCGYHALAALVEGQHTFEDFVHNHAISSYGEKLLRDTIKDLVVMPQGFGTNPVGFVGSFSMPTTLALQFKLPLWFTVSECLMRYFEGKIPAGFTHELIVNVGGVRRILFVNREWLREVFGDDESLIADTKAFLEEEEAQNK